MGTKSNPGRCASQGRRIEGYFQDLLTGTLELGMATAPTGVRPRKTVGDASPAVGFLNSEGMKDFQGSSGQGDMEGVVTAQ